MQCSCSHHPSSISMKSPAHRDPHAIGESGVEDVRDRAGSRASSEVFIEMRIGQAIKVRFGAARRAGGVVSWPLLYGRVVGPCSGR